MTDTAKKPAELTVGDAVCIRGFGTASIVHEHGQVVKVSNLYLTVKITWSQLNQGAGTRRFRRENGASVPHGNGYGGTTVSPRSSCAAQHTAGERR
jgi:hypothetical protein